MVTSPSTPVTFQRPQQRRVGDAEITGHCPGACPAIDRRTSTVQLLVAERTVVTANLHPGDRQPLADSLNVERVLGRDLHLCQPVGVVDDDRQKRRHRDRA